MMKEPVIIVFVEVLLCHMAFAIHGVSVSCMMAYEEGGAPAVFSSPECPQWVFSAESSNKNSTRNCQFSTLQGRRQYQEDRVTCNLDMKLPISDEGWANEVTIGIVAIFDGHGGDEASETASRKLLDYFFLHAMFTAYKRVLVSNKENHSHTIESSHKTAQQALGSILEEALLRTIKEIDSEFSKEALDKRYVSGSTATIVLLVNGQFLVANIGDSKAILCSQKDASLGEVYAEELTQDHHPDREDERARIESAGGSVGGWGVPRVNGILAVSRAIGDVYLKRYGVTAEPEITDWRAFTSENKYLVVASDGIFETLTPQNVCDLLHDKTYESSSEHVSSSLLADWVVRNAFRRGSADNLSAVVISDLRSCQEGRCGREDN